MRTIKEQKACFSDVYIDMFSSKNKPYKKKKKTLSALSIIKDTFEEVSVGETRACKGCQSNIFRRKVKNEEVLKTLPIFQLYHQLSLTRKNIEIILMLK
jgi:hypothetical protein